MAATNPVAPLINVMRKASSVQTSKKFIDAERRRSARFVTTVYAAMALLFSAIAITIIHSFETLAIPAETARFMASAFVALGAANIVILEIWAKIFQARS